MATRIRSSAPASSEIIVEGTCRTTGSAVSIIALRCLFSLLVSSFASPFGVAFVEAFLVLAGFCVTEGSSVTSATAAAFFGRPRFLGASDMVAEDNYLQTDHPSVQWLRGGWHCACPRRDVKFGTRRARPERGNPAASHPRLARDFVLHPTTCNGRGQADT